jgi:hypothetical protein
MGEGLLGRNQRQYTLDIDYSITQLQHTDKLLALLFPTVGPCQS